MPRIRILFVLCGVAATFCLALGAAADGAPGNPYPPVSNPQPSAGDNTPLNAYPVVTHPQPSAGDNTPLKLFPGGTTF